MIHHAYSVALLALLALVAGLLAGSLTEPATRAPDRAQVVAQGGMFSLDSTPRERAVPDSRRTSLGVRFTSRKPGTVTAVQFFRSAKNQGRHRVTLWTAQGVLLGRGTYDGDRTGWVTARLRTPVAIMAGARYVASYVAPHGRYSRTRQARFPVRAEGLTAQRGVRGLGTGLPTRSSRTNFFVDVVFRPGSSASPSASPTVAPTPAVLPLPRIPWEGGPGYWSQFPKARQAGWDQPGFFPISVFLGKPEHADELKALGINTYMGAEHDGTNLSYITNRGISVIAQQEDFTYAEVGTNPGVVGWFISDECEMGYSGCTGDESALLAKQVEYVNHVHAFADGRFTQANFGNGILRTHWSPTTMDQHVQLMDVASADKYTYTSPSIWDVVADSPDWPAGAAVGTAASYGWQADQMKRFQKAGDLRPIWTFVETAMPYLFGDPDARTITPAQLEGAVWSAIIHEARGIAFFQHNNNGQCGTYGTYSLVECGPALQSKVTAMTARIGHLAPVLNTQSYSYDFANGTDTMLKATANHAFIFADIGLLESPGRKTFTLPPGVTGTSVTVVGEGREIPVVDGRFADDFAEEYTHHIYRIAL